VHLIGFSIRIDVSSLNKSSTAMFNGVYVTLKDRKRSLNGKNDHNALWSFFPLNERSRSLSLTYTSLNFFCYSGDGGHAGGGRQKCRVTLQRDTSRPRQSLHGVLVQGRRWHPALQVSDLNITLVSMVYLA